jgi:hypothetical protein
MDNIVNKSILFIIPRMPYPLNSGGRLAIFETIKSFSRHYIVSIIIIDDNKKNEKYIPEIHKISKNVFFYNKPKYIFVLNALFGFIKGLPLQVGYFYFNGVQKIVDRESKSHDIIYCFMIRTTLYGINLNNYKIHNSIDSLFLSYKKSLEKTTSIFWKVIYYIEIKRLFKIEKSHLSSYNLTSFVNSDECKFWSNHGNCITLPHGVEDSIFLYNKFDVKFNNVISFIGRMDYQPNIDAVKWFLINVMPLLNKRILFHIIGGYATNNLVNFVKRYPNCHLLGYLEDPYINLASNICTIAPMQTGGGLQTKILLAMGLGSIVVSTSYSVSAIQGAINGVNILVENDPNKIATIINDIYNNPTKYVSIKESAKVLIKNHYSVSVLEKKICSLIDNTNT